MKLNCNRILLCSVILLVVVSFALFGHVVELGYSMPSFGMKVNCYVYPYIHYYYNS
jgi:hypothetical protein